MVKDVYIITYGSKWAIRFRTGPNLKLYNTLEDAIDAAKSKAKQHEADVYIETSLNKYRKIKMT